MLIDRSAHHNDNVRALAHDPRFGGCVQPVAVQCPPQEVSRPVFPEREPTPEDGLDSDLVDIVNRDPQSPIRERDRQRQPNTATTADHHDIKLEATSPGLRRHPNSACVRKGPPMSIPCRRQCALTDTRSPESETLDPRPHAVSLALAGSPTP